ncbi:MAG: type III pantothenate kinase [Lentisphaeria bacterium]|nr:type III pantothenate kinase [Lentisphaeria bacterium]
MFQILDIGNTHTRIANWDEGKFSSITVVDTAELTANGCDFLKYPAAAACVCPEIKKLLEPCGINFISALNQQSQVDFSLVDRNTLGADRVANAAALAEFYELPGAVIDCGTAITLELVDENRRFAGGAIAPGRALMRNGLALGTSQLPKSGLLENIPDAPGRNTIDAIGFGVGRGVVGVVRELALAAKEFLPLKTLILTGGDAGYFRQCLPDAIVPGVEFTLHGVRLAAGIK